MPILLFQLGSIAGNLMVKHEHRDFASDIFLLFETIGAQLTISKHLPNTFGSYSSSNLKISYW